MFDGRAWTRSCVACSQKGPDLSDVVKSKPTRSSGL